MYGDPAHGHRRQYTTVTAQHCINDWAKRQYEKARSGVYSKWLEAQHVKESGLGYAKYGTKQETIEGALEELNDMLNHYNSLCGMQKEKQWE